MNQFIGPEKLANVMAVVKAEAEKAGIPVVLLGGAAMIHYGSPRMTTDIDVVSTGLPQIAQIGKSLTFGGRAFKIQGVKVDWIVRDDDYAALYADAARECAAAAGYCVVRPEYLAIMKQAAGREKDVQDLVWLLSQKVGGRPLVDRKLARKMAGKYLGGQYAQESWDSFVLEADFMKAKTGAEGLGDAKRGRRSPKGKRK